MHSTDILLIGGGGREHALARALCRSRRVARVLVAPGNGGTDGDLEGRVQNVPLAAVDVVGPEAPLVAGIVDRWQAAGLRCFGPSRAAARLEGSKAFSKAFMRRHGIPTAESGTFTAVAPAMAWIDAACFPVVVKASGLAAGKGVILPETRAEAEAAIPGQPVDRMFGRSDQGYTVVEVPIAEGDP